MNKEVRELLKKKLVRDLLLDGYKFNPDKIKESLDKAVSYIEKEYFHEEDIECGLDIGIGLAVESFIDQELFDPFEVTFWEKAFKI